MNLRSKNMDVEPSLCLRGHLHVGRRQLELDGFITVFEFKPYAKDLATANAKGAAVLDDDGVDLTAAELQRDLGPDLGGAILESTLCH